ncbi:hypothetical protein EX30DRAFT_375276 [Ascodesmis nigricans]|uniref:Velvet domain-containing protein n=1 Tax=Ascodesmis nigricans TaxID=341454 RepID=A0A4S2MN93_9PEZI|nr:hypothetical protein EX30DRAFT_375276 [Ascodesmis nigricans]
MSRPPLLPPVQFSEAPSSSPSVSSSRYSGSHPLDSSTCAPSTTVPRQQQHSVTQRSAYTTLPPGHTRSSPSPPGHPQRHSPRPHMEPRRPPTTYDSRISRVQQGYSQLPPPPSTYPPPPPSQQSYNPSYEHSYDRRFSTDTDSSDLRRTSISHPAPRHRIQIRQQPAAARACGFGERDRRVIDPPPIIQLHISPSSPNAAPDPSELRYPFNIIHCTLYSADGQTDETSIYTADRRTTRRLMGTLVASPFVGVDESGVEGCFFCFPDLSCRTNGSYRLLFKLMRLEPELDSLGGSGPGGGGGGIGGNGTMGGGGKVKILAEMMSDVFTVFTAKEFPGMRPSTALTKALKRQGCTISVKKGNEKVAAGREEGEGEGSEEGTPPVEGGEGGKGKRRRKV